MEVSIRSFVLQASITVEAYISQLLSELLEINNRKESRTLGNKSSALSFKTKVDLLIDIGALDPEFIRYFQKFMEIRNQFIHNFEANSYEACFVAINEYPKGFLLSKFPASESLPVEIRLEKVVSELCLKVIAACKNIVEEVEERKKRKSAEKVAKLSAETFDKCIPLMRDQINKIISDIDFDGKPLPPSFSKIGDLAENILLKEWYSEMAKIYGELEATAHKESTEEK